MSGLFDLRPFFYSWLQPKLLLTHEQIQRESPLFHVAEAPWLPRLVLTLGAEESEEFYRQSEAFALEWEESGGQVDWLAQPRRDHITAITGLDNPHSDLTDRILALISATRSGQRQAVKG